MSLSFPASPTVGQLYPSPPTAGVPVWKWDGSEWVIASGNGTATLNQFEYTGLTTCTGADNNGATLAYQVGFVEVFVNGLKLNKGDFTATNGTSVIIGATVGSTDLVTILAFSAVSVTNTLAPANNLSDVSNTATARANLGAAPAITSLTASLGADVLLNNTANYFDGPSVAQGTSGTWFVTGTVTCSDSGAATSFLCKLWDGTTVIASSMVTMPTANYAQTITLSGVITSPAGNLRISVKDNNNTTGAIKANLTSNSKDSTITAVRIA